MLLVRAGYGAAILTQADRSTRLEVGYAPAQGRPSKGGSKPECGVQRRYNEREDPHNPGVRKRWFPEAVVVIDSAPGGLGDAEEDVEGDEREDEGHTSKPEKEADGGG